MKKLALLFTILIGINAWSQNPEYDEKVYFSDAEYFFIQEFYVDALVDFLEVYNHGNEENANLNYLIGICYLNIPGQKEKSIEYFLKAEPKVSTDFKKSTLKEENAPIDLYLYLGNAYRINLEFDKAIRAYTKYKELVEGGNKDEIEFADQQINACANAKEMMAKTTDDILINIGAPVNNNYANFNPVISGDESKMVYMSRLPFYDAVMVSENVDGEWTEPYNITPEIQSDGDQYICDISYDGKMILLSKEEDMNADIYISKIGDDGVWRKSRPIEGINTRFWESHASFSKGGDTIFFSSNRPESKGGMDIFMAFKQKDGSWGKIKNLSGDINTNMNEDMAYVTSDGTKLYFSSQRESTIGGSDIYVSDMVNGTWGVPKNIGYPMNTTDDDMFFYPHDNGNKPYFYRYLPDGYGAYDIVILGKEGDEIPEAMTVVGETDTAKALADNKDVVSEAIKAATSGTAIVVEKTAEQIEAEEMLEKKTLDIQPIFFNFDSYALSTESKAMLDKVADILIETPEMNLTLSGFTDAFGSVSYNLRLARKRAEAAETYLATKGVVKTRVKVSAKSGDNPLVETDMTNKNAPKNRLNRRVEFTFSGYNQQQVEIVNTFKVPEEYK